MVPTYPAPASHLAVGPLISAVSPVKSIALFLPVIDVLNWIILSKINRQIPFNITPFLEFVS